MTIDKGNLITLKIRDLQGILQGTNGANNLFTYEENVTVEQFVKDASDRFKTSPGQFELVYQDLRRGEIYELSKLPPKEPLSMIHITPSREKEYPFTVEKRKGVVNKPVGVDDDVPDEVVRSNAGNPEGAATDNGVADLEVETFTFDRHKLSRFQANINTDEVVSCGREFVGLKNMTMTCYLNSLIQTLFFTPEFRNAVYMHNATDKTSENKSIALALQKVFLQMQFSVRSSIETDDLTKTFGWRDNEVWMQQDVEELYRLLMDYLSEELKGSPLEGVVPSLFGGIMNDYVECMECHKRNSKEELFLALPLPVRIFGKPLNAPTLEEALQAFVAPEILDGNNQYKCEQCQKPCDAKKGLSFKKFPYILTVTLNRFEFNWRSMTKHKLNDEIVFPMTLDMTNMLDPESLNTPDDGKRVPPLEEKLFKVDRKEEQRDLHSRPNVDLKQILRNKAEENKLKQEKEAVESAEQVKTGEVTMAEGSTELPQAEGATSSVEVPNAENQPEKAATPIDNTYQLYAVLIHRGGVNGGHYFAFIQDFETNQWYRCDDTIVRRISAEEISRTYGGYDTTSDTSSEGGVAYILVYRRQDERYNSLPMTYELLPPHMKAMWDGMKEADQKCYEREELDRNTIKIFVGTRDPGDLELKNVKEMVIQRSATMKEAAIQCYKEFYPNTEIEDDRIRLIRGDKNLNIIENSFEGKDDEIICVAVKRPMPVTDAEGFLLEVRNPEESFESYHQNDIVIFANIVPENANVVQSSTEIHVTPAATVGETRAKILKKLKLTDACVVAVYGNGESAKQEKLPVKLLLAESEESTADCLRVTKILNVYVRVTKDDAMVKEFLTLTSFWVTSTDIQVNFELPDTIDATTLQTASTDPLSEPSASVSPPSNSEISGAQESTYKHQVISDDVSEDKKWRGLKLKVAKSISLKEVSFIISQIVGVDESNFILYKNYADSETELLEFLEENNKLEDCLPFDELRCMLGRRVKPGEGRVNIFLLDMSLPLDPEPPVFKSIIVNPDMPGLEARKIIGDLMEPKLTDADLAKYILRRKITRGPSRIVKDDENLGTVARKLHGTEFYFQLANIPEDCAEGYHSIFIRHWNHATSTLAEPREIFIPQDYTLPAHEIVLAKLSQVLELAPEQIQVANPESFGNFPYNLPMDVIRDRLHWFAIITRPRAIYIYNDELFLFTRNKTQVANAPPLPESESTGYEDEGVSVRTSKRETGLVINLARSPPT